eukprot:scaffold13069_cov32-Attheya_sp.AAC.2
MSPVIPAKIRNGTSSMKDYSEETFTSSVGLPNEAPEGTEPAQGHLRNRIECLSPANRKRPRICLAESTEMAARTNRERNATGSCSSVEKDPGRDGEDPKPSLVTSSVLICSDPDQEVVQEEATPDAYLPAGWTYTKLEPDW